MKAIMVMFDSLNRHMLAPYGCEWVKTPNFTRLAKKTVTFDNSYVGSMPCIPARKELHTGRLNFLHRSWGPLEPWDDSMPEILKQNGVYTHLISDHYHYWEDGGATYHTRYSSWDSYRGQEGDPWKAEVKDPPEPENRIGRRNFLWRYDEINRKYIKKLEDFPQVKCFDAALDFMETNNNEDNWFLQVETFDPHEPFFAPEEFKSLYPHDYDGPFFDWPDYKAVTETPEQVKHLRYQYAALVSLCDSQLGRILDIMDKKDMWKDTMLIVNTDHGYILGEHDYWSKNIMPFYNEIANTPLFIWDPRFGKADERRKSLVTTIDIAPTILEYFGVPIPVDMQGAVLKNTIDKDSKVHDAILFGIHGGHINVTDGKYVYMRAPATPENTPLYNYTTMATRMEKRYPLEDMQSPDVDIAPPFEHTKGCKSLKIPCPGRPELQKGIVLDLFKFGNMLFDVEKDPQQKSPIEDSAVEIKMIKYMVRLMKENDAPAEQYERIGLKDITDDELIED